MQTPELWRCSNELQHSNAPTKKKPSRNGGLLFFLHLGQTSRPIYLATMGVWRLLNLFGYVHLGGDLQRNHSGHM